jgi:hypothetical protein
MPKLKSILAGLAVSTALSGGVIGLGAATTATSADAATNISGTTSTVTWAGCYRRHRCGSGWGWGWRRHHHHRTGRVKVKIHNRNFNRNRSRDNTRDTTRDTTHDTTRTS